MNALQDLIRPQQYPRSAGYDPAWLVGLDMGPHPLWLLEDLATDLDLRPGMRVLGIPPRIKACVGWEAIAWHTAAWWRFHWEITELVTVTSARLQPDGCHEWLLWARACHEQQPEDARAATESVITMLEADGGEFLSFALVAARKPGDEFPG